MAIAYAREARLFGSVAAVALILGGCGAAHMGNSQRVRIRSFPPGATITVGDIVKKSPTSIELDRQQSVTVHAELNGFEPAEKRIHSRSKPIIPTWEYLLLGIPSLFIEDREVEYYLEPKELRIDLQPRGWSPR